MPTRRFQRRRNNYICCHLSFYRLPTPVAGVDEVGRGCLFGPVVAAAVILEPRSDRPPHPGRGNR